MTRLLVWSLSVILVLAATLPLGAQPVASPTPQLSAQPQPAQPAPLTPDEVAKLRTRIEVVMPRLGDRRYRVRLAATAELRQMPPEADAILLELMPKLAVRQQVAVAEVLVSRQSKGAMSAIIQLALKLDRANNNQLCRMLAAMGDEAHTELLDFVLGKPGQPDPPRQPRLEILLYPIIRQKLVLSFHELLEGGGGRIGFYEEMAEPAYKFGKFGLDALADIALNRDNVLSDLPDHDVYAAQVIAIRGIGDSKSPDAASMLRQLRQELVRRQQQQRRLGEDFERVIIWALYAAGDKSEGERLLKDMETQAGRSPQLLSQLAEAYSQARDYAKTKATYERYIEWAKRQSGMRSNLGTAYYNLCCANCRLKDTASAMIALKNAVDTGFDSWEWMFRDMDLKPLWGTDEFKAWIKELRGQPRYADLIPKWEPGKPPKKKDDDSVPQQPQRQAQNGEGGDNE